MKPTFVLSKEALKKQYDSIKEHCDIISYSSKTNYVVSELLEEMTDCMFSIHSTEALDTVKDKSRVWFFAQAWNEEEIQETIGSGVTHFVVDNEQDLHTLTKYLEQYPTTINLLLRTRLKEHTIHTGKYFVYGMYGKDINKHIPILRKNDNIKELGVHFHRKSQNISEWSLQYELAELLSEETLAAIDVVNIGGGLPVQYKNYRAEVLKHIFKEIDTLHAWLQQHKVSLIIEPGRYIAAPAIKLQANVKLVYDNNIIIDCSVYNTALDTFVIHHKLFVEGEQETGTPYTIKGSTPDSMDIFRYRCYLEDPQAGDTITFLNAGAYNYHSDFCKLPVIETEVVP